MKLLIDKFDAAYIISLRERDDRRREVVREFASFGVEVPSPKVQYFLADPPDDAANFPSLGMRGSFTSHRRLLELAVERDLQNLLVFEDDVSFRSLNAKTVDAMVEAMEGLCWDVLYFGYLTPDLDRLSGPYEPAPGDTIGGHFYAVNKRFIPQMLQYMYDCEKRPRDHALGGPMGRDAAYNHVRYLHPELRVYLAVPNLAFQRSSRTDLHPLPMFDRLPALRPAVSALRKVKQHSRRAIDVVKMRIDAR